MPSLRTIAIAAATATFGLVGYAQTPIDHGAHHPDVAPAAGLPMPMSGAGEPMVRMDEQMKTMQAMHDKMTRAGTPEQRSVLMAEHTKVMQDGMSMMGGMGPDGMMGKGGMGAMGVGKGGMPGMQGMQGKGPMEGDMGMHYQMMDKRMQMMQSMMQLMMDRIPPVPDKP